MSDLFDPRFFAYLGVAGLLVLSPGATIAVITKVVLEDGRTAGLWTVLGVAVANSTLSLAAALGMSALIRQSSWMLEAITVAGACYLAWLGARSMWLASTGRSRLASSRLSAGRLQPDPPPVGQASGPGCDPVPPSAEQGFSPAAQVRDPRRATRTVALQSFGKGVATNLLNASVALFYMTIVPQFMSRHDPFLARFVALCAAHVTIAASWHLVYAWFVGTLSERLTRPAVKWGMDLATGLVLIALALRLVV